MADGAEDLAGMDIVLMAEPNPYRNLVQEAFNRAGVRPQSRMEASTQRAAASQSRIAAGKGASGASA